MVDQLPAPLRIRSEKINEYFGLSRRLAQRCARVTGIERIDAATTLWEPWIRHYYAAYLSAAFAPRQERLWEWFEQLTPGVRPAARVEVWPRGGGKSTTVELGCARVAARLSRRFVLYISSTQPQADKHVQNLGGLLEQLGLPRGVNEYGASTGWKHSELRTASGFNAVALGLDAAVRGIKINQYRPDLIILDDIDDREDSPLTREKKVSALTSSILPTGAADVAVLVVQNLIAKDSIVSTLADGRADFLHGREVATVEPAVRDLAVEHVITPNGARYQIVSGTPTWAGQDIAACEQHLNDWGLAAFLREAQHDIDEVEGGLWVRERDIEPFRVTVPPPLTLVAVAVDPSASKTGDEAGILIGGRDARKHCYVLDDRSLQGAPHEWAGAAVAGYTAWHAARLVAEANNGGEMVAAVFSTVPRAPRVKLIHASRGKQTRAEPVQKLYADGRVHHVGVFPQLEREQCTWRPGLPSPNRMDALVWLVTELLLSPQSDYHGQPSNAKRRAYAVTAGGS